MCLNSIHHELSGLALRHQKEAKDVNSEQHQTVNCGMGTNRHNFSNQSTAVALPPPTMVIKQSLRDTKCTTLCAARWWWGGRAASPQPIPTVKEERALRAVLWARLERFVENEKVNVHTAGCCQMKRAVCRV